MNDMMYLRTCVGTFLCMFQCITSYPPLQKYHVFHMWISKSTCDFFTSQTHVIGRGFHIWIFHMWNFKWEISHGKFNMWKVTCDISHVKSLIWFTCAMLYAPYISCENIPLKFHMCIFTSGIAYGERSHLWNSLLFDFSHFKFPMWFSPWDVPYGDFTCDFYIFAVIHVVIHI